MLTHSEPSHCILILFFAFCRMNLRTTVSNLLLLVFLAIAPSLQGQVYYEFMVEVPMVDSSNGNQPFTPLNIWAERHPSYTGQVSHAGGYSPQTGIWRDSIYVYGPGAGQFWVSTVDCNGDTVHLTVPMDSTLNWGNTLADTFLVCAPANTICSDSFSYSGAPGGPTYAFTGYHNGMGGVFYLYYEFGDGVTSSFLNPTHTYMVNGTYVVTLTVHFTTGCVAYYSDTLIVTNAAPTCNTSILPSQIGNVINFYVNSSGTGSPVNFDWDFDDGQTLSTGTNGILHPYASSGTYTPCVITTFSDGCVDTTCTTFTINLNAATCTAWFAYGMNVLTVNFQDSTTSSGAVNTWYWDFGDGSVDSTSGSTVSHTYSSPATYNVTLEIFTADTCYDSVTRPIMAGSSLTCTADFNHAPDTTGQYTILAYNNSVGNNLSYLWDFGDGNTSTQAYPVHQYSGTGTYYVCLTVTQPSPACTNTYCDSVTITQKQAMAFTFGVWNPATQVVPDPPTANAQLQLFPNPAADRLHLRLPEAMPSEARVRVCNTLGQVVLDQPAPASGEMELDLRPLPLGMYHVRAGEATGRFWILR